MYSLVRTLYSGRCKTHACVIFRVGDMNFQKEEGLKIHLRLRYPAVVFYARNSRELSLFTMLGRG